MKKLKLVIILTLSFSTYLFCQKDTIKVENAPANLPQFEGDWQNSVQNDLNSENLLWFLEDPNYYASQLSSTYFTYKNPLNTILASETLTNTLYNWLIAPVKILWSSFNNTTKANFHDILVHCSGYANKFSLVNEIW